MREILFRAKGQTSNKWYEGLLTRLDQDVCHIKDDRRNEWICDSETVCQYTGLKDKNGRKIFEGDILSAHLDDQYPEYITYVQVTWDGFSWCTRESTEDDVMSEYDCNTFEVCGNIFDNPELIN